MIKVAKFGGSSLADAGQFQKVKAIVEADPSRRFVVASACGKSSPSDHKVTDLLYLCQAHLRYGVSYEPIFKEIETKYYAIKGALHLSLDLDAEFARIRKMMNKDVSTDLLVSRGEYLTSRLLAEYLDFDFLDAADVLAFHYDGTIDYERTASQLSSRTGERGVVIPGFYGALPNGAIRVFSRGGSDVSGAVIANVVNADVYENWTDVPGFLVTDPRIVKDPMPIKRINYSELRAMSYMGANVLHDDAVFPVRSKNIPINIRSTNDPDAPGTMILSDCSEMDAMDPPPIITGITGRKNFTALTLTCSHASALPGYLRQILEVFEEFKVSVESVPMTVDTISVIVSSDAVSENLYDIVNQLREKIKPDSLKIEENLAMIAIVGRAIQEKPGMSGRLLSEFGRNQINIKVISQSADELCVTVGVNNRDFEKAVRCIYEKFIAEESKGAEG